MNFFIAASYVIGVLGATFFGFVIVGIIVFASIVTTNLYDKPDEIIGTKIVIGKFM